MSGQHTPQALEILRPANPSAPRVERLKKRAEFLAAAKGKRLHTGAFSLQAAPRAPADDAAPRFGLTVTKKEGSAPARNRMRRRLREALRVTPALPARPGHDYVIVARRESLGVAFAKLQQQLAQALARVLEAKSGAGPRRGGAKPNSAKKT